MFQRQVTVLTISSDTRLAPRARPVPTTALFYPAVALGTALHGSPAGHYSEQTEASCFGTLGAVAIVIGATLLLLSRWIRRTMRGVR